MQEEWRDVVGYEGYYQVSNLGRVKSIERKICLETRNVRCSKTISSRILKQAEYRNGYLKVVLSKNGIHENKLVHRLVMESFKKDRNLSYQVNHKDENKKNNNIDNLEWCTNSYNINYGNRNKITGEKNSKKILQFKNGEFIDRKSTRLNSSHQIISYAVFCLKK